MKKKKAVQAIKVEETVLAPAEPIRLDIGCGSNKRIGFTGVDQYDMPGVDLVFKVGAERWPFEDSTVDEVYCSHFLEHLTNMGGKWERVHFFNEMHRVLKPGATASLIFPHWASNRYYGDPTHCEPFSEMGFYYLLADWRKTQAPHADIHWNKNGYSCNFECTWGYSMHQALVTKNKDYQQFALENYKEAAQDIIANLTCRK